MTRGLLAAFLLFVSAAAGAEERVPWTEGKVNGSPDPPKPYAAEVTWPHLTFDRACDIARLKSRKLIFLTEQKGKIWVLPDDLTLEKPEKKLFFDFAETHDPFDASFSICFHPDFEENREVYVFYRISAKPLEDGTRISRFQVYPDRLALDPATEEILLTFRSGGHNGGHLGFGPDGMLYILTGDSEVPTPPDPLNTGQDLSDLLSSVLRIDVDRREEGTAYAIPKDNPFLVVDGARPEIWAYGFRNPWKLCFHPDSGDLWVGDVGWELWEMLYRVERGSNFGWSILEGVQPIKTNQDPGPSTISPPTVMHPHTEFASITGGYVYEGERLPELKGAYLYGDFVTGQLWGLWLDGGEIRKKEYLADTRKQIVSFGQAGKGEVIFLDWPDGQHLYRLVPNPMPDLSGDFPTRLSETGLFEDLATLDPRPGVHPFRINGTLWQDGATSDYCVAIPDKGTIEKPKGPFASIPKDTVLAKTLTLGPRRIETQLLHHDGGMWQGYTYRWDESQDEAWLVEGGGKTETIEGKSWVFHSRAECARCHNIGSDYRLAFRPGQLDRDGQLERFLALGLIDEGFVAAAKKEPTALVEDPRAPIDLRARTWLAANCSHCHQRRGGGSVTIEIDPGKALEETGLVDVTPVKGDFGIADAALLRRGDPTRSILYYRSVTSGIGHMPMIGARTVDPDGATVLFEWIRSLGEAQIPDPGLESLESALHLIYRIRSGKLEESDAQGWIARGKASSNPMISGLFEDFPVPHEPDSTQ